MGQEGTSAFQSEETAQAKAPRQGQTGTLMDLKNICVVGVQSVRGRTLKNDFGERS